MENKKVKYFYGPMYAGKTTAMLKEIEKAEKNGENTLCFLPSIDKPREGRKSIKRTYVKNSKEIYQTIINSKKKIDSIFIDEIQFFDKYFVQEVLKIAKTGVKVFLSGLDKTFQNEYFKIPKELLFTDVMSEVGLNKEQLFAICSVEKCKTKAPLTAKIGGDSNKVVEIGDGDKYKPVCKRHYRDLVKNKFKNCFRKIM